MSGTDTNLRCVFCSKYLISGTGPRQASCGDRLCEACFTQRGSVEVVCPLCEETINLSECFRDKAVEIEAANVTVHCSNNDCPWKGLCSDAEAHESECRFAVVSCSNTACNVRVRRDQINVHLAQCSYQNVPCKYCKSVMPRGTLQTHIDRECPSVDVECRNKCGFKASRAKIQDHVSKECRLQVATCTYVNCTVSGTTKQLQEHDKKDVVHHIHCLNRALQDVQKQGSLFSRNVSQPPQFERLAVERERAQNQVVADLASKLQVLADGFTRVESVVLHIQETSNETALSLQTLQATTYDGKFVWKIPEVQRRQREAVTGKTTSLYSAPFHTSRHGYKICLRLYMNGDGAGKGTHLSFFVTVMRGEYDALLSWPFRQAVTLILVDQNKQRDIVQSFRPEPTSSSFQRPRSEMNIASGCPMFAPVSVLDNSSYVKEDTMFLKCKVDLGGLEDVY